MIFQISESTLSELVSQLRVKILSLGLVSLTLCPIRINILMRCFIIAQFLLLHAWKSLAELARVLRPGGRIYLSANGVGWYLFLWEEEHNKTADYDQNQLPQNLS